MAPMRPVRRPGPPASAASFVPSQFGAQPPAKSSWENVWTNECAVWTRSVLLPGMVAARRQPTADSLTRALGYQKSIESRCKVGQMTPTPLKWHLLGPVLPATNELHGEHDCSRTISLVWGDLTNPLSNIKAHGKNPCFLWRCCWCRRKSHTFHMAPSNFQLQSMNLLKQPVCCMRGLDVLLPLLPKTLRSSLIGQPSCTISHVVVKTLPRFHQCPRLSWITVCRNLTQFDTLHTQSRNRVGNPLPQVGMRPVDIDAAIAPKIIAEPQHDTATVCPNDHRRLENRCPM